jgi:hypothetical protein
MSCIEPGCASETATPKAVRIAEDLHVSAVGAVLARAPQVMAGVGVGGSAAVGGDERAVEHDVAPAGGPALLEHGVQVGGSGGQHADALVQVAVAGGRRDSGVAGQGGHAGVLPVPAQHQDRLGAAGGGAGADTGAAATTFGDEQVGQQRGGVGGDIERGE